MLLKKILKFLTAIVLGAVIILIAGYVFFPSTIGVKIAGFITSAQKKTLGHEIFSVPLIGNFDNQNAILSNAGVISETNKQREANGEVALTENSKLNDAAAAKLKDMFDRQYFEHISPDGNGPGYLADQVGYSYIIVGENLALGNFDNDQVLLQAWMNSPGHRANILNTHFVNIGVAVGQGMYEGKKTWLAVQEFGAPVSTCPEISTTLKTQVDQDKSEVATLSTELDTMKRELAALPQNTSAERATYNTKADEYNGKVAYYSVLSAKLRTEIDQYNVEVRAFNACLNTATSYSAVLEGKDASN